MGGTLFWVFYISIKNNFVLDAINPSTKQLMLSIYQVKTRFLRLQWRKSTLENNTQKQRKNKRLKQKTKNSLENENKSIGTDIQISLTRHKVVYKITVIACML